MSWFKRDGDDDRRDYDPAARSGNTAWNADSENADRREPILPILRHLWNVVWSRAKPVIQKIGAKRKVRGVLIILPFFLYLAGILAQMIEHRKLGALDISKGLPLPSLNPFICYGALFSVSGTKAILGLLCAGVIIACMVWVFYQDRAGVEYDKDRNFYISKSGTYGTAGWMQERELEKVLQSNTIDMLQDANGTILGEYKGRILTLPFDSALNQHFCVFGASGTMKSRAFSRLKIIQSALAGQSIICTDSKGELFEDTSRYLKEEMGYTVKVLNLINPTCGNTWSSLDGVEDEELLAQVIVDVIIANTGGPRGDHFWDSAEGNLLKGIILYMRHDGLDTTLGNVYSIVTGQIKERSIPELMRIIPPGSPALHSFSLFLKSSETIQSSVIIGLGSRLQVLQNPSIVDLVGKPDIDLIEPGKSKCAYFIITSDQTSSLNFISSLFFSMLFIKLVEYADTKCPGRRLSVPVNLILDEFCNIGTIPDFTKKMSTVRSRGINISVIFQSIGQLENRYPLNQHLEIIGNADTQIFLGCTDPLTASFISERSGIIGVQVESTMKTKRTFQVTDYTPEYRESRGEGKRFLLNPDEVLRLPHDEMLILMRGEKALRAKKFDYTRHPESSRFVHTSINDYNPRSFDPSAYSVKETLLNGVLLNNTGSQKERDSDSGPQGLHRDERKPAGSAPGARKPREDSVRVLDSDGKAMPASGSAFKRNDTGRPGL